MRNARKVNRVMGWELRRQLSEPGVCCADSIRVEMCYYCSVLLYRRGEESGQLNIAFVELVIGACMH